MAQTPGGMVVKLASVHSIIDQSKIYFCLSSPTQPLYGLLFSHSNFTTLKNVDGVTLLVLFSVCSPTGTIAVEEVPIDPGVMVVVDRLVFQYFSGALRGCAAAVSEG